MPGKGKLTAIAYAGVGRPPLQQTQPIAAFAKCLPTDLVHQSPHQINAPAADTQSGGVQPRHLLKIERFPLVKEGDFNGIAADPALNLKWAVRLIAMSVADNVSDRFARGQDDGMNGRPIHLAGLADSFDKCADDRKHPGIAGRG